MSFKYRESHVRNLSDPFIDLEKLGPPGFVWERFQSCWDGGATSASCTAEASGL